MNEPLWFLPDWPRLWRGGRRAESGSVHLEPVSFVDGEVAAGSAGAQNGVGRGGSVHAVVGEKCPVDVYADHLAEHHPVCR